VEVNGADDFVSCSRLASTTVVPLPLGGCRPLGEFLRRRQLLQSTHKCRVRTRFPEVASQVALCLPPPLVKVGRELWLPMPVLRVGLRLPSAGMQRRSWLSLVVVHAPGLPSAAVQPLCRRRGACPRPLLPSPGMVCRSRARRPRHVERTFHQRRSACTGIICLVARKATQLLLRGNAHRAEEAASRRAGGAWVLQLELS
jgi:hypothetical protein